MNSQQQLPFSQEEKIIILEAENIYLRQMITKFDSALKEAIDLIKVMRKDLEHQNELN